MSYLLLTFLFLLFAKHAICDLAIQRLLHSDKEKYFNQQAHIHYFHHGIGSFFAGLVIDIRFAFVIFVLEQSNVVKLRKTGISVIFVLEQSNAVK